MIAVGALLERILTVLPLADHAVGHLVVPDGDHDGGGDERAEKVHHHPRDEELVPVAERSDEQTQAAQDVDGRQGGADVEHAQSYWGKIEVLFFE